MRIEPPFRIIGQRHIQLGEGFTSGPGLWLEAVNQYGNETFQPSILIGNNVNVSRHVHIAATTLIEIGANVLLGSNVMITDHNHGSYRTSDSSHPNTPPSLRNLESGKRTLVGARVWLGDGVVITPGATIGDGSVIGANSVVVGSIPPNCIAVGVPARVVKVFDFNTSRWVENA